MIGRPERFLEPGGTISSDRHQSVSEAFALLPANAVETLTNRGCHGERDRFTGTLRKLSCETLRSVQPMGTKLVGRPAVSRRTPRITPAGL